MLPVTITLHGCVVNVMKICVVTAHRTTLEYQFNEPRRETENSSFNRAFVKVKGTDFVCQGRHADTDRANITSKYDKKGNVTHQKRGKAQLKIQRGETFLELIVHWILHRTFSKMSLRGLSFSFYY